MNTMTFANVGTLGTQPGRRDEVAAILTRTSSDLGSNGCLLYEVGINEDSPNTVFVMELWESQQAHQDSLELPSVQAAIAEAMPLLNGDMGGNQFDVVGSPLTR
jgi:quinol monooxygenase YgiN